MPALDHCHPQVVRALEKAGWVVVQQPYTLQVLSSARKNSNLFIDLLARHERDTPTATIMVVEAKCFEGRSDVYDLYGAIGQYVIYRSLLRERELALPLYLAVPVTAYHRVFREFAMPVISELGLKLIVIDMVAEVIEQWIE
jgi:hypothetical protein